MTTSEDSELEDVRRGIDAWLAKQGYELEHVAAEAMRRVGYDVSPGVQYGSDPARETDILGEEPKLENWREVRLLVECKHARLPWIVRTSTDVPGPINRVADMVIHRDAVRPLQEDLAARESDDLPFDLGQPQLGVSIIEGPQTSGGEPGPGKGNAPYQALQQLTSAVRGVLAEKSIYDGPWALLPVLVIEGSLWSLAFEPGSKVEPVDCYKVRWAGLGDPLLIDVVTRPALDGYLQRTRAATTWLAEWLGRVPKPRSMIA